MFPPVNDVCPRTETALLRPQIFTIFAGIFHPATIGAESQVVEAGHEEKEAQDATNEPRAPDQRAERKQPQAPENLIGKDAVLM
jgi:hypothetical protein